MENLPKVSLYLCVWERESVQTGKAYLTTVFYTPCYFRNVATEFSESHASLQENIRLCLSCLCQLESLNQAENLEEVGL